jgi:hypothetical protein
MRLRTNTAPAVFDPTNSTSLSAWELPGTFSSVDAAFNGALNRDPFCYFFKGPNYVRYIWTNGVDINYPKSISNMIGVPAPFYCRHRRSRRRSRSVRRCRISFQGRELLEISMGQHWRAARCAPRREDPGQLGRTS